MGDRSQVAIKQHDGSKVYLYGHWIGADIYKTVAEGLRAFPMRTPDSEYLARIIFSRMVVSDLMGETGFGISTSAHQDIEHVIPVLDCAKGLVEWEQPAWDHNQRELPQPVSFKTFCAEAEAGKYNEL